MNTYDIGNIVRCKGAFKDLAGAAFDPLTVTAKIKTPLGAITTYVLGTHAELIKDSTGNYRVNVPVNAQGVWAYRFEGTGANASAGENTFQVRESVFD